MSGLYWGNIWIMEKDMETSIEYIHMSTRLHGP